MNILFIILISTTVMSLASMIGVFVLFLKESLLNKILLPLVALSAGALLGGAFFHMLPEIIEKKGADISIFIWVLVGFSAFFILEHFISWHHCHKTPSEHKKPVTYLILTADAIHNFIDGLAIGGAFLVNIKVGLITWLAIFLHEIPQELGDFGILIHGGWKKTKALMFNYLSSLSVILGGLVAYVMASKIDISFLLPFAAGNFIYISASDLIPEIKKESNFKKNLIYFAAYLFGIVLLLTVKLIFEK